MFCGASHPLMPEVLCSLPPGHLSDGVLHCASDEPDPVRWDSQPSTPDVRDRIVLFIADYVRANGYAPAVRDVAAHVGRTPSTVAYHLAKLVESGRVSRTPGLARAVTVVLPGDAA